MLNHVTAVNSFLCFTKCTPNFNMHTLRILKLRNKEISQNLFLKANSFMRYFYAHEIYIL